MLRWSGLTELQIRPSTTRVETRLLDVGSPESFPGTVPCHTPVFEVQAAF